MFEESIQNEEGNYFANGRGAPKSEDTTYPMYQVKGGDNCKAIEPRTLYSIETLLSTRKYIEIISNRPKRDSKGDHLLSQ